MLCVGLIFFLWINTCYCWRNKQTAPVASSPTYLRGTVNFGAIIGEVIVDLFPAHRLQLFRKKKSCKEGGKKQTKQNNSFGPLLPISHHVIPDSNGHLCMSSLTDVETVNGEETRVSFAFLVKTSEFQPGYISLFAHGCLTFWCISVYNLLQLGG